jgi:hypothetical protein
VRAIVQRDPAAYDVSAVSAAPERPPAPPVPSGRLLLRMQPDLHAELTRAAEREGKSLNAFITGRLADSIGWGDAGDGDTRADRSRLLPALLVANGVVVGLAAIVSVAILLIAWLA